MTSASSGSGRRLRPRTAIILGAVVLTLLLAALAPLQVLAFVQTPAASAADGQSVGVQVAGDEDPWGPTITFTGVQGSAPSTTTACTTGITTATGTDPAGSYSEHACGPFTFPTLTAAGSSYASMSASATVSATTSGSVFYLYLCPDTACSSVTAGRSSGTSLSAGSTGTVSLSTTSNLQGQSLYAVVRAYTGIATSAWTITSASATATGTPANTVNPSLGTTSYTGTLAPGQPSPAVAFSGLHVGANTFTAHAQGSQQFQFSLAYTEGLAPAVSGLNATLAGGLYASASDANTAQGDHVVAWEWKLSKDGTQLFDTTTAQNTTTFTPAGGSYVAQVRAQDSRSAWSPWASRAFTITAPPTTSTTTSTSNATSATATPATPTPLSCNNCTVAPSTPAGAEQPALTQGKLDNGLTPSASPGDFLHRAARGWVSLFNWVSGHGFNASPPSWLPDWLARALLGAGA